MRVGQLNVHQGGTELFVLGDGFLHYFTHIGIQPLFEKLSGQADAQTIQRLGQARRVIRHFDVGAGGILGVETGHGIHQQGGIFGGLRHGAALIQ